MDWKIAVAAPLVAYLVVANASTLKLPDNWGTDSHAPEHGSYSMGIDPEVRYNGMRALAVRTATAVRETDYGATNNILDNFGYEGHRVRFSGMLKTQGVATWAGLYLRADTRASRDWHFADVQSLLRGSASTLGSSDWHPVSVVVQIPPSPGGTMDMGLVVIGTGQAWVSDLRFEEVGDDVPLTTTPIGLDLAKVAEHDKLVQSQLDASRVKRLPDNLALREATAAP